MNLRPKKCFVAGAMALLAGCATGPDFQPPAPPKSAAYAVADGAQTAAAAGPGGAAQRFSAQMEIPEQWWRLFQCAALDASVREALENSPTLAQALARLHQAREEYNAVAGATRYPAVDVSLAASRQQVNPAAMGLTSVPTPDPFTLYNASVSVSYVFDLFGRNRRALEAVKAEVDRRGYELDAARQTLAANVVLARIRQAETESRLAAARDVVAARRDQLDIAQKRFAAGGISGQELERQGVLFEQAQAALPALEQARGRILRQLAVYLGREPVATPEEDLDLEGLSLPAELPLSLPSELARRRPDVRAAEALWQRACANVGVATADLYPRLTLTASAGAQRTDIPDLLDKMNVWSVGGALLQPVFRGGALRAKKRAAVAAYDEAAAVYRETVLRGLQQVADALDAVAADARALASRAAAADHAKAALAVAERQLAEGGISRAAMLEEKVRWRQAELDRIEAQAARYADTAAQFHALGGGCEKDPPSH